MTTECRFFLDFHIVHSGAEVFQSGRHAGHRPESAPGDSGGLLGAVHV